MNRICWQCPNPATNPEEAPIAICNECFGKLQEAIKRTAEQPGRYDPPLVSPKEYERLKNDSN